MFDRIRDIVDSLLAERERRANIDYYQGLSEQVLRDIGVERCDIEKLFDNSAPGARRDGKIQRARFALHG